MKFEKLNEKTHSLKWVRFIISIKISKKIKVLLNIETPFLNVIF